MMKVKLLFLISMCLTGLDVGYPSINAVCEVELYSGEKIVGAIEIARGGYDGITRHGFACRSWEKAERRFIFFGLYRFKFEAIKYDFLEHLCSKHGKGVSFKQRVDEEGKLELSRSVQANYTMSDSIYICRDLPNAQRLRTKCGYWNSKVDGNCMERIISIHQIKTLELLEAPPHEWTEKIDNIRNLKYDECDYNEPVWYHEILKNPKRLIELGSVSGMNTTRL